MWSISTTNWSCWGSPDVKYALSVGVIVTTLVVKRFIPALNTRVPELKAAVNVLEPVPITAVELYVEDPLSISATESLAGLLTVTVAALPSIEPLIVELNVFAPEIVWSPVV